MPTVTRILEGYTCAETPHWDVATQSLYFVDSYEKKILKYTPSTKTLKAASTEKNATFVIPVEGEQNEFVISQEDELVLVSWDGEADEVTVIKKLVATDPSPEGPRTFNDAKCDPNGRLWTGGHTYDPDFEKTRPWGILYSLDSNLDFKQHADQIRFSNGLAFNTKAKKLFYNDTLEGVFRFDFDVDSGTVSNKELWFSFRENNIPGFPDGMTIDTNGNLWVAAVMAGQVLNISGSQRDTLISSIKIPGDETTCVTFAGENLDDLYVTTAAIEYEGKVYLPPENGAVYKVTGVGAKGFPAAKFKLN